MLYLIPSGSNEEVLFIVFVSVKYRLYLVTVPLLVAISFFLLLWVQYQQLGSETEHRTMHGTDGSERSWSESITWSQGAVGWEGDGWREGGRGDGAGMLGNER